MNRDQWDIYWAFRDYFLDDPKMRISTKMIDHGKFWVVKVFLSTTYRGQIVSTSYCIDKFTLARGMFNLKAHARLVGYALDDYKYQILCSDRRSDD